MIYLYCERSGPGLWSEPLNAATNVLFLLAALICAWRARRRRQVDSEILAAILGSIGIGSGLFHLFATRWALWLDVLPILAFEFTYLGLYLGRVAGLSPARVTVTLVLFAASIALAGMEPALFNGSLGYVPAWLALAWLGWDYRRRTGNRLLLAMVALFGLSLALRTVDLLVCPVWRWGTHWAWHALNAVVLGGALEAYMRCRAQPPSAPLRASARV
ncbi:MAG: ceramidase domain-containing protein [Gammaproteobacteria bacterium]